MSLFDRILTQPILNLLAFIYNFIGDFGLSIIIVTVLIRLLLWPLVKKQLHQTKAMREIQPELKKIKARAKGDRMAESMQMMELYKEKNIKPFSSMLVMLIQLPILIAIFRVIQILAGGAYNATNGTNAAEFIYPFLAHFGRIPELVSGQHLMLFGLVDLAKTTGGYLPSLLMALLAGFLQFFQSKQIMPDASNGKKIRDIFKDASKGKDVDQSDMMAATSRNMIYFMPIMTVMIALALPGAVVLYYATTSLIAIIQQHFILSKSSEELDALSEAKSNRKSKSSKTNKNSEREKKAQEAVVIRKKSKPDKQKTAVVSGKTVVRRIKAK